jgi:protein gp37
MGKTKIEWTGTLLPDGTLLPGYTFNGWWGCTKRSAGCRECYSERDCKRWGYDVFGVDKERRFFGEKHWNNPLRWNRKAQREGIRRKVFTASMSDVLEDRRDLDEWREKLWDLIRRTEFLDWLILTKRIENSPRLMPGLLADWPANARLGVTAENQERADHQIPRLLDLDVPNFISVEPMLGPIDLAAIPHEAKGAKFRKMISWLIIGGESGHNARPFPIDDAVDLIRQCKWRCRGSTIKVFVKQMGTVWARERGMKGKGDDDYYWDRILRVKEFPK